jgi:predicted ribosomally synthesized peptide with SipW-like signal peptide
MRKKEKVLLSFLLIGVLGGLAGLGVYSAFSSTTTNSGNDFTTGSVTISDNDSNQALYSVTNQKPGDSPTSSCIKVTYTGSLAADVKLYTSSSIGAVGQYVDLTITPGTQSSSTFPDCTGFTADGSGPIYSGTLQNFASSHSSYANGLVDYPGSTSAWNQNNSVVYQFTVSLQSGAPDSAQGLSTGSHAYTWEARNQ